MNVGLLAEGTYPHQFGGVSVWCDQLIRGMPEHRFDITALVATGAEPITWELPGNVGSVTAVPLWGPPPAARRSRRRAGRLFRPLLSDLLDVLLDDPVRGAKRFGDVLRDLFEYAQAENLRAGFEDEESVRILVDAWRDRPPDARGGWEPQPGGWEPQPTVHDALTALQLLEHSLRPLSLPPMRADVLHAVTNGLGALPALCAKWRYDTPLVVTEHGIYLREQYLHHRRGPYRFPVKALHLAFLRQVCALGYREATVITPGNVYNKRWEERLGASPSRIRTVYNGVDPMNFPPVLPGEPAEPTISWVGRIDPIKDLDNLLHAFALVHRQMPEARLRIFGSPPAGRGGYLAHCRRLAAALGVGEAATFEGRVDDVRDAYDAGHLVVLCSVSEGFPYSLIEAMTCGRPCVATDVGGVSEAVGDTGLVVPPRSPEPLARACLTLLRDGDLRRRLGAAARDRALELFTVDRAISTFDEIYGFLGEGLRLPTVYDATEGDGEDDTQDGTADGAADGAEAEARSIRSFWEAVG